MLDACTRALLRHLLLLLTTTGRVRSLMNVYHWVKRLDRAAKLFSYNLLLRMLRRVVQSRLCCWNKRIGLRDGVRDEWLSQELALDKRWIMIAPTYDHLLLGLLRWLQSERCSRGRHLQLLLLCCSALSIALLSWCCSTASTAEEEASRRDCLLVVVVVARAFVC